MGDVYVEFFSDEALENVMCMLQYQPERIVYLGHKSTMVTRKIKSLTNFARIKAPKTELEFIEVPRDDLEECIAALTCLRQISRGLLRTDGRRRDDSYRIWLLKRCT